MSQMTNKIKKLTILIVSWLLFVPLVVRAVESEPPTQKGKIVNLTEALKDEKLRMLSSIELFKKSVLALEGILDEVDEILDNPPVGMSALEIKTTKELRAEAMETLEKMRNNQYAIIAKINDIIVEKTKVYIPQSGLYLPVLGVAAGAMIPLKLFQAGLGGRFDLGLVLTVVLYEGQKSYWPVVQPASLAGVGVPVSANSVDNLYLLFNLTIKELIGTFLGYSGTSSKSNDGGIYAIIGSGEFLKNASKNIIGSNPMGFRKQSLYVEDLNGLMTYGYLNVSKGELVTGTQWRGDFMLAHRFTMVGGFKLTGTTGSTHANAGIIDFSILNGSTSVHGGFVDLIKRGYKKVTELGKQMVD